MVVSTFCSIRFPTDRFVWMKTSCKIAVAPAASLVAFQCQQVGSDRDGDQDSVTRVVRQRDGDECSERDSGVKGRRHERRHYHSTHSRGQQLHSQHAPHHIRHADTFIFDHNSIIVTKYFSGHGFHICIHLSLL